eukprot:143498_1
MTESINDLDEELEDTNTNQLHDDHEAKQFEQKDNIIENNEEKSTFMDVVSEHIDDINKPLLNEHKDKIMEYVKENKIDHNKFTDTSKKEFIADVINYCGEKKLRGPLGKLYNAMTVYIDSNNISKDNNDEKKTEIQNNGNTGDNAMINILNKTIDGMDDEKLNQHKDKIVEYFEKNNIDDIKFKSMERKKFVSDVSNYCKNPKLKGSLTKLFKQLNQQKTKRSSQAIFASDILSIVPQQGPQVIDEQKLDIEDHKSEHDKEEEKVYADYEESVFRDEQMPTYINRAIWFRSDDENLERLVDKAV